MSTYANRNQKIGLNLITVLTALVQGGFGQSYLLTLGQNQRNFFVEASAREAFLNKSLRAQINYTDTVPNVSLETHDDFEDNNTTIIVIKSVHEQPDELSQTAMDIITIIWYVATFLALAAFFLLMACSDRRCSENRRNVTANAAPIAPPTPSPSYSEFAPPSYDTVIKMQRDARTSIFVIPFTPLEASGNKDDSNNSYAGNLQTATTPTTPTINFYTVDELNKLGS